jgi:hypothetical protein
VASGGRGDVRVYCLEGNWSSKLTDKSSVRPMLELLHEVRGIEFIHQTITVPEALHRAAAIWRQKQYARYRIGYLAFHMQPGAIRIGRTTLTLESLGEMLGEVPGKIIHLSGCSILEEDPERSGELKNFIGRTRAKAVCGYTKDVDWIEGAAFDMLLIDWLNHHPTRPKTAIDNAKARHPSLVKKLGFVSRVS